jgi:shikimate dehydrogenase
MSDKAAVLGKPISHSLSPVLHRAAYKHLKLDWEYSNFELDESELSGFLDLHADFRGFSLTMPLKRQAFQLADSTNQPAQLTEAVNTLVRVNDKWVGYNTDVPGAQNAIRSAGIEYLTDILILGSGATARSIIAATSIFEDADFTIFARNQTAVKEIALQFPNLNISFVELSELEMVSADYETLLVNTLPASVELDVELDTPGWLFDVTYAPWPTKLAAAASEWKVISGLDLLVNQAILQVELMTGLPVGDDAALLAAMYSAGNLELQNRSRH